MNILNKINNFYINNKPFVVYRKPNKINISGFFMDSDELFFTDDFTENGFIFAPFDTSKKAILYPLNISKYIEEQIHLDDSEKLNSIGLNGNKVSKENHINIVEKTIEAIHNSELKKVVISRKEVLTFNSFQLLEVYKKLLKKYENAFVYVWYHPKVGLWLGATPETLLKTEETHFKTMSLAGTRKYNKQSKDTWKSKEIEEQQLVTDFIEEQLNPISKDLKIDKTETIRAGSLLHLRTKIEGELTNEASLNKIIRALHPTPAICGLPRDSAKQFIINNENYDRSFYTGFLGEINLNIERRKKSSLFVNLRCMEVIDNNTINLYIGGGITKDSNAEKEWEETVSKSETMKNVL